MQSAIQKGPNWDRLVERYRRVAQDKVRLRGVVRWAAQEGRREMVAQANKLIYDTPPSDNYARTGRLRASIQVLNKSDLESDVILDSSLYSGVAYYPPYVDRRTLPAPAPFFTNTRLVMRERFINEGKNALKQLRADLQVK